MRSIHPKIVTDEQKHPIAVQIDYADWLRIQKILRDAKPQPKKNLAKYAGTIKLNKDPLGYQKKIWDEWK